MSDPFPPGSFVSSDPLDWWRGGYEWLRCSARMQELWTDRMGSAQARRNKRDARLVSLLAHARSRSRFLARHWSSAGPEAPLHALAPTTRGELMAHFDDWVTDPEIRLDDVRRFVADPSRVGEAFLGRYAVWTSSGTTGVPGIYVQDEEALAIYGALLGAQADFAPTTDPRSFMGRPARLALVAATGGHFAGVVWWQRLCRMYPLLAAQARVFSILEPLDALCEALAAWNPTSIASYPTVLNQLAAEQRAGRVQLAPRTLLSGGEALCETERLAIEKTFDCAVVEDYGASECMNIAHSCSAHRLHVNQAWVVLEPVDEHMQPVPPGESSFTVLVTNLANQVQPIVRYDLGDSVTIDPEPCECGDERPTLRVSGRADDVLEFDAQHGEFVRVLPLAIETVLEEDSGLSRFQLTQIARDELQLRIELIDSHERQRAFDRAQKALARFLSKQGVAKPVHLQLDDEAPQIDRRSGKLRRIRARTRGGTEPAS
ncbi:MAG: AMP-binding protein [Burkholderiaceae bacterium]|nr:AMP-binding protein [Burkholderiaceae bacterium]